MVSLSTYCSSCFSVVGSLILIYYIKLQCPFMYVCVRGCMRARVCACVRACVCVCLSVPPFRHDRLRATKFGRHVRIDPGIIRTQICLAHPTPGGLRRDFRGSKIKKVQEMSSTAQKINTKFNPSPTHPVEVLVVKMSKVREIS